MPPRSGLDAYREVWLVDFEFSAPPGERPDPVCLVAREFRSGRTLRLWQDDLRGRRMPPYPIGSDALFVAYFASAELGCHLALDWPLPARVLDLYVEFRNRTNGLSPPNGFGLLGALTYHGLDAMDAAEKKSMRELAIARRSLDVGRTGGVAGLLRVRRPGVGQVAPRDGAGVGSLPGRGLSGPLHGGRGPDGMGRSPDRYGDPLPAPGRLGDRFKIDSSERLTPGSACLTAGRSRPSVGPVGWPGRASRGPGWSPGSWRWTMTRSGRWPGPIPTWP